MKSILLCVWREETTKTRLFTFGSFKALFCSSLLFGLFFTVAKRAGDSFGYGVLGAERGAVQNLINVFAHEPELPLLPCVQRTHKTPPSCNMRTPSVEIDDPTSQIPENVDLERADPTCHALYVLCDRDIMYVPKKYIMDRWRKDFKRKYACEKGIEELDSCDLTELERYDAILEVIVDDVPPPDVATGRQSIKESIDGHRKGRPRFSRNKAPSEKKINKTKAIGDESDNNINNEEHAMKPKKKRKKKVNSTNVNVDDAYIPTMASQVGYVLKRKRRTKVNGEWDVYAQALIKENMGDASILDNLCWELPLDS
ncbi:hypothetical protein Sjap_020480 [Stephania japonica]|uniref:Uncharacterized protein n=1 Tax=Stephania japonica TaxID=461633 RepID=A0AAP0F224_9MAGN